VAASCSLTCLSPCAIIWTTSLILPMAAHQRLYDEDQATVMRMAEAFGGPAERSAVGAAKDGFFLKKKTEKSFKIEKADQ
jgi:hypothetical protein